MLVLLRLRGKWDGKRYRFSDDKTLMLWRGRLAYAKGETTTNETVPTGPWAGQIPYVLNLFNQAQGLYNQGPPQYYPGQTVASTPGLVTNTQQAGANFAGGASDASTAAIASALQSANGAGTNPTAQAGAAVAPSVVSGITGAGNNPLVSQVAQNTGTATLPGVSAPTQLGGGIDLSGQLQQQLNGGQMDPYLQQVISTGLRPLNQQFNEQVLPGIRGEASQAGQVGGTRQGVAEGIAARGLQDSSSDLVTRLLQSQFEQANANRQQALGLTAQVQGQDVSNTMQAQQANANIMAQALGLNLQGGQLALGQSGQGLTGAQIGGNLLSTGTSQAIQQYLGSLGLLPSLTASGANSIGFANQLGLQQYGLNQNQINADMEKFFYNEYAPYNALTQFQNYISGSYGSSTNNFGLGGTQGVNPFQQYNPYQYAIG